jgi:hypothetical protein
VTHTFLNGPATNQTLADDAGSSGVTWMLADQQNSARDVIDNSATRNGAEMPRASITGFPRDDRL